MNLVQVSDQELMEVDGGWRSARLTRNGGDRRTSGGWQNPPKVTQAQMERRRSGASLVVHVAVGVKTGGPAGAAGGAALWAIRNW